MDLSVSEFGRSRNLGNFYSCDQDFDEPENGHYGRSTFSIESSLPSSSEGTAYYTTFGLLVCYGPPRALLLVAAQALGFRSSGRGRPLHSRPGPSGVGVADSAGAGPRCR